MRENLPDELNEAINLLEESERKIITQGNTDSYFLALDDLEYCIEDFPEHKDFIEKIRETYIKRLIDLLYDNKPEIDTDSWLQILVLVFFKNQQIAVDKIRNNPAMEEYFADFLGLVSEKSPSELPVLLDDLLTGKLK